jgi:hypothetical protein
MTSINFPLNPQVDDVWEQNNRSWRFDGQSWQAIGEQGNFVEYTATTGSAMLPKGTTAQRDVSPAAGYLRYNTESNQFEGYGTAWGPVGNPTIVNDLITNTTYYVTLSNVTSGTTSSLRISTTKLSFNPSTGTLSATAFSGNGAGLTGVVSTSGAYADPTWITSLSAAKLIGTVADPAWITSISAAKITGTISGDRGVTSGSTTTSFVGYNGTTKLDGRFYGGTTTPDGTTRLNYSGHLYATKLFGDGSGLTNVGATGGSTEGIFWENGRTVTTNYTVTAGKNAGTFGPITVNNDVVVTVPSNSVWTIV